MVRQSADVGSTRRWVMLAMSMLAQATSAFFIHGAAFLIPVLQDRRGLTLAEAGLVAAMSTVGVTLTLIAWGAAVDRFGERLILVTGLLLTGAAGIGAALADGTVALCVFLLLGGMAAASTSSASGRVVVGWFPRHRRGLAMGIRQMAQPLGVGMAAFIVPTVASRAGIGAALAVPAALAILAAVLCQVLIMDPPRPTRAEAKLSGQLTNPYRQSSFLWRIHAVSVLLVVPQFTVWTFALVWLISERDWSAPAAGLVVAATQVLGALGRIAVGVLSDRVGSRMRPLRWVAIAAAITMLALAVTDQLDLSMSVVILVVATVVTVADNGLAFTSIAEVSGPFWSGRALGTQNTAQFLAASVVPPAMGAMITVLGFPLTFAITALFPLLATPLVPAKDESALV
jgi:sugar phosphate permease